MNEALVALVHTYLDLVEGLDSNKASTVGGCANPPGYCMRWIAGGGEHSTQSPLEGWALDEKLANFEEVESAGLV